MKRKQFTFYRSYYEAISELPKREQSAVLLAVCAYALDEAEPVLSGTAKAVFTLIKPTLDSGRKKAANRSDKTKSNPEQTKNKTASSHEQKPMEKETEGEEELEMERDRVRVRVRERMLSNPLTPFRGNRAFFGGAESRRRGLA